MKILARLIIEIEVSRVIKVPPRYRKLPRSASIAAMEKQVKTSVVPNRAVTTIAGSITLTYSNSGPIPIPEKHTIGSIIFIFTTETATKHIVLQQE